MKEYKISYFSLSAGQGQSPINLYVIQMARRFLLYYIRIRTYSCIHISFVFTFICIYPCVYLPSFYESYLYRVVLPCSLAYVKGGGGIVNLE